MCKDIVVKKRERMSKAKRAGMSTAKALIEMVNLMYQNNTAKNFLTGLCRELNNELNKRMNKIGGNK